MRAKQIVLLQITIKVNIHNFGLNMFMDIIPKTQMTKKGKKKILTSLKLETSTFQRII
jgi:hypothetical protein